MIGDELGRLRNPVLRRQMFTTPTDRQMMARGMPSGIMNSGPEIANAAMRPNPFIQHLPSGLAVLYIRCSTRLILS